MSAEDQRIIGTVTELLSQVGIRQDDAHTALVRRHLRSALETIKALEYVSALASRRGRELQRRESSGQKKADDDDHRPRDG
jgi:hypothetical protein